MDYEVLDPVQHELVIKNEFDAPEINPALAFIATLASWYFTLHDDKQTKRSSTLGWG